MMTMNLNEEKLAKVVQDAFDKVAGSRRWQTAIVKAKRQLEENPFIHFDGEALLILSPSNEIYRANGVCQCKAFEQGVPCWHRAAMRLVQRYMERSH
jgi:hypothetical protein